MHDPDRAPQLATTDNAVLASLSTTDLRLLRPHLAVVSLKAGDIHKQPGAPGSFTFFPQTAVLSVMVGAGDTAEPDVGLVGREGLVGWVQLLGDVGPVMTSLVRVGGASLSINANALRQACQTSPSLQNGLLRPIHEFMGQMAETIQSSYWPIESRVARWLIMVHDRSGGHALSLTHDHISSALQVRRASVTNALHLLEGYGALTCTRSRIIVRDRALLAAAAKAQPSSF